MLLTPESIKRTQSAYDWIRANLRHGCRINRQHSSYGLKHVMEGHTGVYVCNGEFIVAMLLAGFKMNTINYNPAFNVFTSDVRSIVKQGKVSA